MGGLFGLPSGNLAPDLFRHIIPWRDVEPVGIATGFVATAGVVLGGGLGGLGITAQFIRQWQKRDHVA